MAALVALQSPRAVLLGKIATGVIAGTVTVNSQPAARRVLVYKNTNGNVFAETVSDAVTGNYQLTVAGGGKDRFRVVIVGDHDAGEYTLAIEGVQLA